MNRPNVLMVTGSYEPEITGANLQCRSLIQALRDRVGFTVLTTTTSLSLEPKSTVDRVEVLRIHVNPKSKWSKFKAIWRLSLLFLKKRRRFDIVHLHGVSQKSLLLVALARILSKKLILKLTSVGFDDPVSMIQRYRWAKFCYTSADYVVGVSPKLKELYHTASLNGEKFRLIPNGVDLERFSPASEEKRQAMRRILELKGQETWVLFVGFFSKEKGPDVLFEAWADLARTQYPQLGLIYLGATQGSYYEIDADLSRQIRLKIKEWGLESRVLFIETTNQIESYYAASDLFVLPSIREGLPNALLEAMASGLACIATRIPGVTDTLIREGDNGLLVPPKDIAALKQAMESLLQDLGLSKRMGQNARLTIEKQYALPAIAERYFELYQSLVTSEK